MDTHSRIAAELFSQHGLNFETAERAGGWTNAVWLNGDVVLRLSNEHDSDRIRREAARSAFLPLSVGYPNIIATGVAKGYEWSLSQRIPGEPLSAVWDGLHWDEKAATVREVIGMMDAVHAVDVGAIEPLTHKRAWYNTFDEHSSLADIERYVARGLFTPAQGDVLRAILLRFYEQLCATNPVLCHGDITTDNLLWRDGHVVALLDFEHAAIAPSQLDVHSLINLALIPYDESTQSDRILMHERVTEVESYVSGMISLFKPYLADQREKDLFMGYSVLFRQRFLEFWLANPEGDIAHCDAYRKLQSLSDGHNGYLAPLL